MGRLDKSALVPCYCSVCKGKPVPRSLHILHNEEVPHRHVPQAGALQAQAFQTSDTTVLAQLLQTREATLSRVETSQEEIDYWRRGAFSPNLKTRFYSIAEALSFFEQERAHFVGLEGYLVDSFEDTTPPCILARKACFEVLRAALTRLDDCLDYLKLASSYQSGLNVYNTDSHFKSHLSRTNPALLIIFLMAVALHLLAGCSRQTGSFCLQMVKLAMKTFVCDAEQKSLIDSIPGDIRTARKLFATDPGIVVYAACPKCHNLYAPDVKDGIEVYPSRCSYVRFPGKPPCSTRLCKLGVRKGLSVRVPIRPYAMQSFTSFLGGFYSRPGIESALRSTNHGLRADEPISDIGQSPGLRQLLDSDGRVFLESEDEIRTIWSLSYDGFNPFHNKAAGKSASAGVLAMVCLSLPPELCYKRENIYLVGIIPGPKQPAGDALNPYLTPLIDTLVQCYEQGTWFTRTFEYPAGRRSKEALVPNIDDLPASRKISGSASHSARRFCSLCYLLKADINNIDRTSKAWSPVTEVVYRESAEKWRHATSKSSQAKLYKELGVRWSELLRLRYWDPTRYVVIDGMHNLFLGLVKHHFRVVIGMEWEDSCKDEFDFHSDIPSERAMQRGRTVLSSSNPSISSLLKLSVPVLRALCEEQQVTPEVQNKRTKKQYVMALLSSRTNQLPEVEQMEIHSIADDLTHLSLDDELPSNTYLSSSDLDGIHNDIKLTTRPSWKTSPPVNIGTSTHGKLKADEWRACIEFDLPVSLLKMWPGVGVPGVDDRLAIVHSTFLLSVAIKFATSPTITQQTIQHYSTTMLAYIKSIRKIRPAVDLRPIHHNALHLSEFLERFGPMRGWWMFPIERLIGSLQKLNINYKPGELEQTMLKSFCSMSQIRVLFQQLKGANVNSLLNEAIQVFDNAFPSAMIHSSMACDDGSQESCTVGPGKRSELDSSVYERLQSMHPSITTPSITEFDRCVIDGKVFSTFSGSSRGNSQIFHNSVLRGRLVPAIIRSIFIPYGMESSTFFLAVHNYSEQQYHPILASYPHFGAGIWSKDLEEAPELIPSFQLIHGAISRPWEGKFLVIQIADKDYI
ncbi:hypothetical protein NP233_g765 [Leucocoprinus birnbaumii]|uniref:Uncharacterized protein n=1 Tax=Leucocoprinus birnbaumii TaxID=56174 RepID=A0AAD5YVH3_9AGAR|nr:hypothetical protein NP233_g765 [Leucocoprinus birnbaumii]